MPATSITDVRNAGAVTVLKRPIYEPLNAPIRITDILQKEFGSNYNITYDSNLYKFVIGLIGDNGVNALTRAALTAKIQNHLAATYYDDLDRLFGNAIGLPRLPEESYSQDPFNDVLTSDEWDQISAADASYRHRCLTWMRAIMFGGSPAGLSLAGEAATGYECSIFEQYKYLNDNSLTNLGQTTSRQEFIVIPRAPSLTQAEERELIRRINRLKPANTLGTIVRKNKIQVAVASSAVAATSEGYRVKRLVTGRADVNWPAVDPSKGYWITTAEQEAPTASHLTPQEDITYLDVASVTASSSMVGVSNSIQRGLFPSLAINQDPFYVYSANNAIISSATPLSITAPWFQRD